MLVSFKMPFWLLNLWSSPSPSFIIYNYFVKSHYTRSHCGKMGWPIFFQKYSDNQRVPIWLCWDSLGSCWFGIKISSFCVWYWEFELQSIMLLCEWINHNISVAHVASVAWWKIMFIFADIWGYISYITNSKLVCHFLKIAIK